jgi:SAM-dependent methyltransferase
MTGQSEPMDAAQLQAPVFEPPPVDPRLAECLKDYPAEVSDERIYHSIELMERYSVELAVQLLRELNVLDHIANWQSPNDICRALHFQSQFASPLGWLLERSVETGLVEAQSNGSESVYRSAKTEWQSDISGLRDRGTETDSGNSATFDLLDHAAAAYPAVAKGQQSGEQSLFGPKGIALWLNYFNNQNLTYAVNNWLAAAVAAERLSSLARIRILEIGAGAGSGSQALLTQLKQYDLLTRLERFVITEPNAYFRRRIQRELTALYPNQSFEWSALDLDEPWSNQITPPGEFDLVFAVNVLHVSKDLLFSLSQAGSILAPGGWLVIGECVRPFANQTIYPELMFQNLESFSGVRTEPNVRPRHGFLTPEEWRNAFNRSGFEHCQISPDLDKIRTFYSHFFTAAIAGQKPNGA